MPLILHSSPLLAEVSFPVLSISYTTRNFQSLLLRCYLGESSSGGAQGFRSPSCFLNSSGGRNGGTWPTEVQRMGLRGVHIQTALHRQVRLGSSPLTAEWGGLVTPCPRGEPVFKCLLSRDNLILETKN